MIRAWFRPAQAALLAALIALPALAHVVSMSTGDLKIEDRRAHYDLRMPLYEMAHVAGSEQALFDHIRFSSGGAAARLVKKDAPPTTSFPAPSTRWTLNVLFTP
jgi:hypothetical protein